MAHNSLLNIAYYETEEEILASRERFKKRQELEKKMEEERQSNYIKYVKERLRNILNNQELLNWYYKDIDLNKKLLWYDIHFKKEKNLNFIFWDFDNKRINSNSIWKVFLKSGEEFIKEYFSNIDKKMWKMDFIYFISFVDYEILVKLIIIYEIFPILPDIYKKYLIDSTDESVHYSIVKCYPKYAHMFSNISTDEWKKNYNDDVKVEKIKDYRRNKLQNKK